jgi:serine/threonine protein kinase
MSEVSGFDIVLDPVDKRTCLRCGAELSISGLSAFTSHDCPECNHPFTVPARLGSFLLLGQLGKGGMGGVVYLGKDETLDRNVAIKVMPASMVTDDEVLATFKREAQAAARLNHSNIAHVYSFGQENGQPYIVMELLSGVSLDRMIEEQGPLDEAIVVRVGLQIADALRTADEGGLIHGDIKPENILFDERMNAKLVDFGIATFVNQGSDQIWGTPYYISPEKLRRQRVDARSDIYCLGGTLYHALTGHPPFDGDTPIDVVKARLVRDPIPLSEERPGINEELMAIINRMLQREPAARYPTYVSLISDLRKLAKVYPEVESAGGFTATKKMLVKGGRKTGQLPTTSRKTGQMSSMLSTSRKTGQMSSMLSTSRKTGQMPGMSRSTGGGRAARDVPARVDAEDASDGTAGRKLWRVVAVLLLLAAVGGAVWGGVWWLKSRAAAKQGVLAERLADLKMREARDRGESAWRVILQTESNAIRVAAVAQGWVGVVSQAVYVGCGEVVSLPAPEEKVVATSAVAGVAAATNVVAATSAVAVTNAVAATNEVGVAEPGVATGVVEVAAVDLGGRVAPAEAVPPVDEPGIKKTGRQALQAVRRALDGAEAVQRLRGQAQDEWSVLQTVKTADMATSRADALSEMMSRAASELEKIRKSVQEAEALAQKAESEKVKIEKKRAEDAAAREAEEKQQAAALAAQQQEQELRQATEEETGKVEAARLRCVPYVKQFAYKQAISEMEGLRAGVKTEGGLKALAVVVDRYKRMDALKTSIIKNLKDKVYEFGWTQGASPQDVLGADEKDVKLKTHTVPWAEVTVRQYLQFVNNLLAVRDVTARTQGELNLAAAIYCFEVAEGNEKALEKAKEFGRKALSVTPAVKDDVTRLLPFEIEGAR